MDEHVETFLNPTNAMFCDKNGNTPLHHACYSNDLKTVKMALEVGMKAALKVKNAEGEVPIDCTYSSAVRGLLGNQ